MQNVSSVGTPAAANNLNPLPAAAQDFDLMPDGMNVRLPVAKAVLSCSGATIYRLAAKGKLTPRRIGARLTGWNVGELRAILRGE